MLARKHFFWEVFPYVVQCFSDGWLDLGDYESELEKMRQKKSEEDGAIAELLEPLLKNQRASDYAEPPAVQKPLLNNEWAGLAEKVWAEFEMIFFW